MHLLLYFKLKITTKKREFLKKFWSDLIYYHLKSRATVRAQKKQLRQNLIKMTYRGDVQKERPRSCKRQRWYNCQDRDWKTYYYCAIWYGYLCLKHAWSVCETCLSDDINCISHGVACVTSNPCFVWSLYIKKIISFFQSLKKLFLDGIFFLYLNQFRQLLTTLTLTLQMIMTILKLKFCF